MANNYDNSPNWAFLTKFEVWHDNQLYLKRWRLFECPWFGFYLHHICRPDRDRDLHDHPWPFISFILKGMYSEEVPLSQRENKSWYIFGDKYYKNTVRWFNKKKAKDAHRIQSVTKGGVWSLVIRGRRQRVWGFYTKDGWKPWNEYLENK